MMVAWLLGLLGAMPLSAQETASPGAAPTGLAVDQVAPVPQAALASPDGGSTSDEAGPVEGWQTVWGLVGLRFIVDGPKVAPNGQEFHPNFSFDIDFNLWLWRSQRLYLFADARLWGEKSEDAVTNGKDGFVATSKRQFDLSGGAAWNYSGPWELRAFGYTLNNLNRGSDQVTPSGFADGFGLENRYYLAPEYARLGETGFDVARATFLSFGYYPSKDMLGNDGKRFSPGMMLRAYLTYDVLDWPCYLFGDVSYISERTFHPKIMLFDVGLAARPLSGWQQWEFRVGVENNGDFQTRDVLSLWYASIRYVF
jgi:hypothetical protein